MWYECKWDNSPSKSQFIKVNHYYHDYIVYSSKYGLQHRAMLVGNVYFFLQIYSYVLKINYNNSNFDFFIIALEEGNVLVGTDLFQFRTPKKSGQMAAKGNM